MTDRHFTREEEFLDQFFEAGAAVRDHLADQWQLNLHCDDNVRANRANMKKLGMLSALVFRGATVSYGDNLSVHVALESTNRTVGVRATLSPDGTYSVETILDKAV